MKRIRLTEEEVIEWLKMTKVLLQQTCEDDAISRQAVKDGMLKYGFTAPDMTVYEFVEDLQPVQPISRWTPVSERLPEENGYYLTTTMYHEVYCDYWDEERFNRTETVIAWMPLPKGYEPRESEDKE